MIKSINLENFKGFKKLENLPVKPITILSGTNSCGKSSILQSILLLKQTLESKNLNQTLLLNGRFVHLGTFENLIFEKDLKNPLIIEIIFKVKKEDLGRQPGRHSRGEMPMHFLLRELVSKKNLALSKAEYEFHYKVKLKTPELPKKKAYIRPIIIEEINYWVVVIDKEGVKHYDAEINLIRRDDEIFQLQWERIETHFSRSNEPVKVGTETCRVTFANLFPVSIQLDQEKEIDLFPITFTFFRFNDLVRSIYSNVTYIGPLREEPSRRYIYEDEIVEIGVKGENAAYIFLSEQENELKNTYFYNKLSDSFELEDKPITLLDAINRWHELMNIKGFKPETVNEVIHLNLNANSGTNTRVSIADVGFGVSQIFPILLEGLRISKGSTMLLEQPEIHLHPNLQMQLADYFISIALSGKRVVVETHSDHIINRLVRRIIEDNKHNIKDLIGIYFVSSSEEGSFYEEIEIDEFNGIVNWPKGFFDQTATEQEKIIRASINKRKGSRDLKIKNLDNLKESKDNKKEDEKWD